MAARPLALLALAVLAVHLLLLGQGVMREPPRPAGMRALVTRVLELAPTVSAPGPSPQPVVQEALRSVAVSRPRQRQLALATKPAEAPKAIAPVAPDPPQTTALPQQAASAAAAVNDLPLAAAPAASAASTESSAPSMAFAIPGSVSLRYAVAGQARGKAWTVNGQLVWRHDGSTYDARLEYSAPLLPSRVQQSTGRITSQGLAPRRFSDKGRGEQATHFERDSGTLVFSNNAPQQALEAGVQDRLSVFLQLASMVAANPTKFTAGTGITLQTAGTRDSQPWLFTVEGEQWCELPGGRVGTLKLVRSPRGEYDTRVELWLGTSMDYVPVRIRLTQPNGDFVDQQWASTDRS